MAYYEIQPDHDTKTQMIGFLSITDKYGTIIDTDYAEELPECGHWHYGDVQKYYPVDLYAFYKSDNTYFGIEVKDRNISSTLKGDILVEKYKVDSLRELIHKGIISRGYIVCKFIDGIIAVADVTSQYIPYNFTAEQTTKFEWKDQVEKDGCLFKQEKLFKEENGRLIRIDKKSA